MSDFAEAIGLVLGILLIIVLVVAFVALGLFITSLPFAAVGFVLLAIVDIFRPVDIGYLNSAAFGFGMFILIGWIGLWQKKVTIKL